MRAGVVIPVGPGHDTLAKRAVRSVQAAWETTRGPFTDLDITVVQDPHGELGRSAARNHGMDSTPADWHFLLDADDRMMPGAFELLDDGHPATFGAIRLDGKPARRNLWPVTRRTLFHHGARGTLSMGCFVRGDLGLRFDESLDAGEDFDFYLRLPGFVKRRAPLVDIGYSEPSAGGPRGYATLDWTAACDAIIARYPPPPPPGVQPHTLPRPRGLVECHTVADIGAGIRPMAWYEPARHLCVEPYEPYAAVLREHGYECVVATALEALPALSVDAVYMLDVIEHMGRGDGREAVELARRAARRQVVVYTPLGFVEQTRDVWEMGGDRWQRHRSGWTLEDFPASDGWRTQVYVSEETGEPEGFYALWENT